MTSLPLPKKFRGVKTNSHAHAPKQERALALGLGGKLTKASGALDEKGDVRIKGLVRIEAKCTTRASFSITKDMIRKIEEAAVSAGELPIIAVDFLDEKGKVTASVAVMPHYVLQTFLEPK
jgi:hypothetical protein